jgi:hypothetical protein
MKQKHTSAPWETNYTGNIWGDIDNPGYDGDSPLIAKVFEPLSQEQLANAQLISAAPELLKALKDMVAMIYEGVPESEWQLIKDKATAIIAKAERRV